MPIESFVGRDGTARIVINGRETKFRAPSLNEARDKVRDMAVAHAVETHTAQHFIAYDPDANYQFYIAPDGTMSIMPTPVIAPRRLPACGDEPGGRVCHARRTNVVSPPAGMSHEGFCDEGTTIQSSRSTFVYPSGTPHSIMRQCGSGE